jgi:hypothetical protein
MFKKTEPDPEPKLNVKPDLDQKKTKQNFFWDPQHSFPHRPVGGRAMAYLDGVGLHLPQLPLLL